MHAQDQNINCFFKVKALLVLYSWCIALCCWWHSSVMQTEYRNRTSLFESFKCIVLNLKLQVLMGIANKLIS